MNYTPEQLLRLASDMAALAVDKNIEIMSKIENKKVHQTKAKDKR